MSLSVNAELADAIRAVNAAFHLIPDDRRPSAAPWDALRDELDAARAAGDRERALSAIRAWRDHWVATFDRDVL